MTNENIFKEKGYCIVKNAISNELRDFITQYALFDEMQDFSSESMQGEMTQVPNAHSKYADPLMEVVLLHLFEDMQKNTGLKLYPTYSYYRVYRPGDDLKIHTDRSSCEISCTLCFNYGYDDSKYQWPIYMQGNKIDLFPGDMVIYRGCELDHWREVFDLDDNNAWQVQGFFHYVDQNGPYADYKYDKRNSIGEKRQLNAHANKNYIKYI